MSARWHGIPFLLSLAVVTACSNAGRNEGAVANTRDSAGIAIVENQRSAWSRERAWRLSAEPVLSIGMREGPEEYQLFRVYGSVRLSDGRIVVANAGTGQLRFFDSDGRYLRSAGQQGSGPGEFRALRYVFRIAGDSLLAWDSGSRRASIFDAQGVFRRSYSPAPFADSPFFVSIVAPLTDGTMIAGAFRFRSAQDAVELGLSRDTLVLVHLDAGGELIATAGQYPGTEWYTTGEYPRVDVPFARGTFVEASGTGFYLGDDATYQISYHRPDGSVERIIRKAHDLIDVTPEAVQEQKRQWIEGIPLDRRQGVAQMFEDVEGPPTMPAFSEIKVDADGNLWVRDYQLPGDVPPDWTVFRADGSMLGTVAMPDRLVVHQIGSDYVLGRWRDEEDVEYVRLYQLHKP